MNRVRKGFCGNESGAVAVYVAIGLVVFLGCGALALDIAHLVSVKRELIKAAEAGALSGARGLWPKDLATAESRDPDWVRAIYKGFTTAAKNKVEGVNLHFGEVLVEVGRWNYATKQFTLGHQRQCQRRPGDHPEKQRPDDSGASSRTGPQRYERQRHRGHGFRHGRGQGHHPHCRQQRLCHDPGGRSSTSALIRTQRITAVGLPKIPTAPTPKLLRIISTTPPVHPSISGIPSTWKTAMSRRPWTT